MRKILLIVIGVGLVTYGALQHLANQDAEEELNNQLSLIEMQSQIEIEYASVDVHLLSDKISVRGIVIKSAGNQKMASVELASLEGYRADEISQFTEVRLNGVRLNEQAWQRASTFPPILLGSRLDFVSSLAYEPDSGAVEVKVAMNAKKVVAVDFSANFYNATPLMQVYHAFRQQETDAQGGSTNTQSHATKVRDAWLQLETRAVRFELKNLGRLPDLLEQQLERQGLEKESFMQVFTEQVYAANLTQKTKDALLAFANGLQRLYISAQFPVGSSLPVLNKQLSALAGQPEEAEKILNLQVEGS
ncbi:hypothetical protein [Pseudoalteromonas byunsanensis]|uniref:Uncharacterized protein n=1 Tax=Pseudoalteromonas byunsanensis TaxID=327939 RepID=A0A1S1N2B8_9GAMM|nr:hypothetical protein [Pseudoalteromonas byunsanensis]OHU94147.1 hypothetical protein BIW53_18225 [Pseudoalteromonas byunsanensis]